MARNRAAMRKFHVRMAISSRQFHVSQYHNAIDKMQVSIYVYSNIFISSTYRYQFLNENNFLLCLRKTINIQKCSHTFCT